MQSRAEFGLLRATECGRPPMTVPPGEPPDATVQSVCVPGMRTGTEPTPYGVREQTNRHAGGTYSSANAGQFRHANSADSPSFTEVAGSTRIPAGRCHVTVAAPLDVPLGN
jgi:hypothetical protein